ncbi:hypothetical protein OIE67_41570 [Nonomuraea fuscirosea]|uniref:hypothetical protein n=1 Tax=Nonomuraea fuscirosea TaxID=1291556 RepID=UPI002DD98F74|nr:hypothetical protein [Nonomuraea fuscirosea]WSA50500.1 hypothetical protein OIE67_41570 [Nonomuraea fuscirosea]
MIRLKVEYLPGDRDVPPVRLWSFKTGATGADVDRCRQAFLRRFDVERTYRFWKQTLRWTRLKLAPKPARPGPGRPPGIPNRRPAPRYDVGKTVKRGRTLAALQQSGG